MKTLITLSPVWLALPASAHHVQDAAALHVTLQSAVWPVLAAIACVALAIGLRRMAPASQS
ncbi:MAG: hypothetical protein AAF340_08055 [Pseudomonadota bacterium]